MITNLITREVLMLNQVNVLRNTIQIGNMYYDSEENHDAYLQEQAYLDAQGQAEYAVWIETLDYWYHSTKDKYLYATVRFFPTGDPLPVYMMPVAVEPSATVGNHEGTKLHCVVIKSYNPQYANRESVEIPASVVEVIEPEITKFNPNVDF
jgi:hypothetical protein